MVMGRKTLVSIKQGMTTSCVQKLRLTRLRLVQCLISLRPLWAQGGDGRDPSPPLPTTLPLAHHVFTPR